MEADQLGRLTKQGGAYIAFHVCAQPNKPYRGVIAWSAYIKGNVCATRGAEKSLTATVHSL